MSPQPTNSHRGQPLSSLQAVDLGGIEGQACQSRAPQRRCEIASPALLSSQGQNLSTSGVSDLQNTFLAGFHAAFIVCAAFAAIGIFTSLVRGNESKNKDRNHERFNTIYRPASSR